MCINKRIPLPENDLAVPVNDNIVYNGDVNDGRDTRQNLALRLQ
jgi:hypothetical protein